MPQSDFGGNIMKVGDSSSSTGIANSDSSQPVIPKPGEPFTTQGGETLQSISQQAYGDNTMTAALSAIHGVKADQALPAGVNITLPNQVKVEISSERFGFSNRSCFKSSIQVCHRIYFR